MPPRSMSDAQKKLTASIAGLLIIAAVVILTDQLRARSATTAAVPLSTSIASSSATSSVTATPAAGATSSAGYKSGTYTASSSYYVPHGRETIQVSVTLNGDTISGISIQNSENDRDSAMYQEDFASEYKTYVVGKSIADLNLNVIAGASDTTQGFSDALNKIASQAQA